MKFVLTTTCFLLFAFFSKAQNPNPTACTAPGQNPSTAFPVCGTSTFTQASVPICGGQFMPTPTCGNNVVADINPFWYKFTCFQSGTLGFQITPHINSEDYDWQLFDVTGRNYSDVYNNVSTVVACNWSGEGGITGASNAGAQLFVCDGLGKPLWSKMPSLIVGHDYLLLVSHFTQTQSGYDLSFGGGTAVITDSTQPRLGSAEASCGGDIIRVKLNKKMKCSSIATDGSDFFITPGNVPVVNAIGIGCSTGFDSDSIELHLNSFLAPGTYTLNVKSGGDGNTILDYCDKAIPTTDKINFTVFPLLPTPMDSIKPLLCKPQSLKLSFRKPMLCSTVAADGSDFTITGPYPVTISGASGNCSNGTTGSKEITINLSQPLYQNGNFTLTLKNGSDGNTILDECGQQTPAGSSLVFSVKDTVNADFTYQKLYGCSFDTVNFFHPGSNGVNSWKWTLDESKTSTLQNPQVLYAAFNQKNVQLVVSNGFCTDTSSQIVSLDNFLKADFTGFEDNCPNEATAFTSAAIGKVVLHHWDFGDGGSSPLPSPTHIYAGPLRTTPFIVSYTVTDSLGCQSTAQKTIRIYSSCLLAVPSAFTPNNDGLNDYLYPLNAVKAEKLDFRVYNRWGQLIFQPTIGRRDGMARIKVFHKELMYMYGS
jgi:PKD repeat protein